MRILIYGINFYPELTGTGKYTGEMACWLASRGHDIEVVTAPPYYPEWRIWPNFTGIWYRKEELVKQGDNRSGENNSSPMSQRLTVWRCPLWVPKRVNALKRVTHLFSFAISSIPIMLGQIFWRPQVVIVVEPTLLCAPMAWLVARLSGAKAWLHIQDFEILAALNLGMVRFGFMRRFLTLIDRSITRRFDCVSTISDNMLLRLNMSAGEKAQTVLFPNWVDIEQIYPMAQMSPIRRELKIDKNTCVLLYSGSIGEKQGLEIAIEAAKQLERIEDIILIICGEGAARPMLEKMAGSAKNIKWLPLQPLEKLNDLLNVADIHLLPQLEGAEDLVLPSKLGNMLASGRPVVAIANKGTEIEKIVAKAGKVVNPGDLQAFVSVIQSLSGDKRKCAEYGKAGRRYAEQQLSKDQILSSFEANLEKCIE